mgnify:CR=1 FL=1
MVKKIKIISGCLLVALIFLHIQACMGIDVSTEAGEYLEFTVVKGDDIPLSAQIVSMVSTFCALTEKRTYRVAFTKEEALQIIADDKAIDRGERMSFDLDKETEKMAKKYANTGTRQTKSATSERKRKENPTKAGIIAELATFLLQNAEFCKGCKGVGLFIKDDFVGEDRLCKAVGKV